LCHPGIAELLDAGLTSNGQPYLIIEYVEGEQIERYCNRHGLGVDARIRLFLDLLGAIAYAHTNLIVHRDIKPSNVLVRSDGHVKLLDFGIAKLLEDERGTQLTREGVGPLTPEYAAPEQLTGGAISTATDIYALGVLLYLLLTGQRPYGGDCLSPADLIKAIVETEPARPSEVAPGELRRLLRGDLDTIVGKALKKGPAERYESVTALADDLRRFLRHEPIAARRDSRVYRAAKFVRRNRAAVSLVGVAVAALLAGIVGTMTQARTARTQRDFALRQLARAEEINDLNSFLLSDAAPLGKPFTVNELLAHAEQIVAKQRASDISKADLLISIGRQYWTQDETNRARHSLDQAYSLSRGIADRSIRARASCALASVFARTGEPQRAEALIREGLGELLGEPQFTLDRVFCLLRGAEVARIEGASHDAIARTEAALRLARQSPLHSDLLELRALMDVAESYRIAGRNQEALGVFEKAFSQLTTLGRGETQTAGTLLNNWALSLGILGRHLEAERLFRRAIAISSSGQNEESVSPMLLINNARELRDLNRLKEAAAQAERGYSGAQKEGDQVVVGQSLIVRSSIYRMLGDLPRATQMLSEAEAGWHRGPWAGDLAMASIQSQRSLVAQVHGDFTRALALANEAMSLTEGSVKTGRQGADFIPMLLIRRAGIELELHRSTEAAADGSRALTALRQTQEPGSFSSDIGLAHLALGRALHAEGKAEEAHAAFRSAADHFAHTLGPDHPETLQARQLLESR
jgi:tetratricopeptide (TPR) repeat protein